MGNKESTLPDLSEAAFLFLTALIADIPDITYRSSGIIHPTKIFVADLNRRK